MKIIIINSERKRNKDTRRKKKKGRVRKGGKEEKRKKGWKEIYWVTKGYKLQNFRVVGTKRNFGGDKPGSYITHIC